MKNTRVHLSAKSLALGLVAVLTLVFSFASESKAALILTINSAAETVSFSGSDSGDPFDEAGTGVFSRFRWVFGSDTTGVTSFSVASGLDFSNFTPGGSLALANLSVAEGEVVLLAVFHTDVSSVDFAGNGASVSYSSLPVANKAFLESLTSSNTLALSIGTGPSPVQINAIPEPTPAALMGLAALGYGLLRRWRAVNS